MAMGAQPVGSEYQCEEMVSLWMAEYAPTTRARVAVVSRAAWTYSDRSTGQWAICTVKQSKQSTSQSVKQYTI